MKKKSNYLGEFFKKDNKVGSVTPSSKFLVRKLLASIDFSKKGVFLELGPGNGVVTAEILNRMTADSKLVALEINEDFVKKLNVKFNDRRIQLECKSAECIPELLKDLDIQYFDSIISSLPLAIIDSRIKNRILLNCKNALKPGGQYIQYQYSLNDHKRLQKTFEQVDKQFVVLNIPPAFVYECRD